MTSPLKVDLIIHCIADQCGCRSSVCTLFLLRFFGFSVKFVSPPPLHLQRRGLEEKKQNKADDFGEKERKSGT